MKELGNKARLMCQLSNSDCIISSELCLKVGFPKACYLNNSVEHIS